MISKLLKRLIGVEDIAFDTNRNDETFSEGGNVFTKLNAKHIPLPTDSFNLATITNEYELFNLLVKAFEIEDHIDANGYVPVFNSNMVVHRKDSAPTTAEDSTKSYKIGHTWIDTSVNPRVVYMCLNDSEDAAEWVQIS